MEARSTDIKEYLLTAEEKASLLDIIRRLRSRNIRHVKDGLVECNILLMKIESRFDVSKKVEADDIYTLLLKYLLLTEAERQQLITLISQLYHLSDPASVKSVKIIRNLLTDYNSFKKNELQTDNLKAIDALPVASQFKLLTVIDELRTAKNICFKIERQLLLNVIASPESFSLKQLMMYDNLIRIITSNVYNVELRANSDKFLMLRYLALETVERKKILEVIAKILEVKAPDSASGKRIIKKQIDKYNSCMRVGLTNEEMKEITQTRLNLSEVQQQQLQSVIMKLLNTDNLELTRALLQSCNALFKHTFKQEQLNSLKRLFAQLESYVILIKDLIIFDKHQRAPADEISSKIIDQLSIDIAELSKKIDDRSVELDKVNHLRSKFIKSRKAGEISDAFELEVSDLGLFNEELRSGEKTAEKIQELKIATICALLKQGLFLHVIETQQGLLDEEETHKHANTYTRKNIDKHQTEHQLMEFVLPFYQWRQQCAHLLPGLITTMPLLETISTLLLALKNSGELLTYPALFMRATRLKEILPTHNKHMHNIRDILTSNILIKRRFTEFLENTLIQITPNGLSTASTVPPLLLDTVSSDASELFSGRARARSHVRRNEYRDMRGISLAALSTLFSPPRIRAENIIDASTERSDRDKTETKDTGAPKL